MSKAVRFEVPKEVKDKKFEQEYLTTAQQVLKEQTVLRLFEQGKVSNGYAAKMLGLSRYQFIDLLAKHRVPLFNYAQEELDREFQAAAELNRKLKAGGKKKP
jgi:predicted HTH domain antitoxin